MMPFSVRGYDCVRALTKLGFVVRRQIGNATALERDGRIVVVRSDGFLTAEELALVLLEARVGHDELEALLAPARSGEHAIGEPIDLPSADVIPLPRRVANASRD